MNVLIISNNCMSNSGAAGRTIQYLFSDDFDYHLSQFYVCNEVPDEGMCCKDFFRITNRDIIKGLFNRKETGKRITPVRSKPIEENNKITAKKTVFTSIVRNYIWNLRIWKSPRFEEWIKSIKPDIIFMLCTDATFLIKIALNISEQYRIPIILYNTERYYFADKCYMYRSGVSKIFYPLWLRNYRKNYALLMNRTSHCIYNTKLLSDQYNTIFEKPSSVIYPSTQLVPKAKYGISQHPRFVYMGNLGLNRYETLIMLGEKIKEIDELASLDVYGEANNPEIINELNDSPYTNYCGVIPYEEVVKNLYTYDFIVHVESFKPEFIDDVRFGFSTKIADCLACGTCLIAVADSSIAFMKYLAEIEGALLVNSIDEVIPKLKSVIDDDLVRRRIVANASKYAIINHSRVENAKMVFSLLKRHVESED